jgi:MFS family permease
MDMSFPAATIILSNSVSKEHQGIAASLINTVVNYSISLGLGFAGTVEVHVNRGGKTPQDVLRGYRGAWYLGMGLSGLGMVVSALFVLRGYREDRRRKAVQS